MASLSYGGWSDRRAIHGASRGESNFDAQDCVVVDSLVSGPKRPPDGNQRAQRAQRSSQNETGW